MQPLRSCNSRNDLVADFPGDHPAFSGIHLVLGGNVFGWTLDRDQSFAVLYAFFKAGRGMIDTAKGYSNWIALHAHPDRFGMAQCPTCDRCVDSKRYQDRTRH